MIKRIDLAWNIFSRLQRNYPFWPSTFGPCCKCGQHGARGGGECIVCLRKELAELVGFELADDTTAALEHVQLAWSKINEAIEVSNAS